MKQTIQTMQLGAALSVAVALAACGGGNGDEEVAIFQPGEVVTFAATLEDGSTQESHYLVHGVTANGELHTHAADASEPSLEKTTKMSGGPHNRPPLAMVALPLESAEQTNTPRLAALRDFYQQLWQGIATRRGPGADIAAEIGAFESDVGVLYDDYQRSEFASVKDYVAFYEQVGENPFFDAQEAVEEELVEFFYRTGWPQGAWLQALQRQQWDWPRFLQLMAQRGDTFFDLLGQYHVWSASGEVGMEALIARYVAGSAEMPAPVKMPHVLQGDMPFKTKSNISNSVHPFFVVNSSWDIPLYWHDTPYPGVGQSSYPFMRILSIKDQDVGNYYDKYHQKSYVCRTTLSIQGRRGKGAKAIAQWEFRYDHLAHHKIYGEWLNNFESLFQGWVDEEDVGSFDLSKGLLTSLKVNVNVMDIHNADANNTGGFQSVGFTTRVTITPSFIFNAPWVRDCTVSSAASPNSH